jgi:predicted DNA-binding transcriptional regulator YafY
MVTLKTIERVCGVPERTAYRYINDISEANFPVVYDKRLKAYRLYQRNKSQGVALGPDEAVMLVSGLRLLAAGLGDRYQGNIEMLISKLISSQEHPLEEILDAYEEQLAGVAKVSDCSEILSSMLINAAIRGRQRLKLERMNAQGKKQTTVLDQPTLSFKNEWRLVGSNNGGKVEVPLDDIEQVSIIR